MRILEKPILFNTEMVQAILEDRKINTRRITKFKPYTSLNETNGDFEICEPVTQNFFRCRLDFEKWAMQKCSYKVGDILYVRETFANTWTPDGEEGFIYKADGEPSKFPYWGNANQCKDEVWIPSIHMPKEAARIFLKVTNIRVERIKATTAGDCKREGIKLDYDITDIWSADSYIDEFKKVWDSIYEKQGFGWNENPWVYVIEFERLTSQYKENKTI